MVWINLVMVRIWIQMVQMIQISFEWFKFAFQCFEFRSNGLNPVRMSQICIRMFRIPFEWFEFAFECFKSRSNGSNWHSYGLNLHSIVSNPIWMVRIWVWISFKWFEFAFNCFESIVVVRICIRKLQIPFEWFELAFEYFESCSNGSNFHSNCLNLLSNAWNPVRMVQISIRMVWIPF